MPDNNDLVVPIFRVHSVVNEARSLAENRPIYDDMEVCEIRLVADRQTVGVFPAHEVWRMEPDPITGLPQPITYALRFPEQYRKFKAGSAQSMAGTPIEELPFLSQGKRLELKAQNIYTAEQLAAIGGPNVKNLGMGGQELVNKAQAYLDNAKGSADVTRLAAENTRLKEQMEALQADMKQLLAAKKAEAEAEPAMSDDDIKAFIKERTGASPRGNPSRATLLKMMAELSTGEAA